MILVGCEDLFIGYFLVHDLGKISYLNLHFLHDFIFNFSTPLKATSNSCSLDKTILDFLRPICNMTISKKQPWDSKFTL